MNVKLFVGEKRRFQGCWTNGTALSAGAWTVDPSGPTLGTPIVVTEDPLSGTENTFVSQVVGSYTLRADLPLTDGQSVVSVWHVRVVPA